MGNLVSKFIATLGTFGPMVAFIASLTHSGKGLSAWQVSLVTVFIVAGASRAYLDVREYRSRRQVSLKRRQIRDYMYRWIDRGGKVAIFSRDLSWVADNDLRDLLRSKAVADSLMLFVPRPTQLSTELHELGAATYYYPHYVLRSRFTVINVGRADTAVAIGRTIGDTHVVEEYSSGPVHDLTQNILGLMTAFCQPSTT